MDFFRVARNRSLLCLGFVNHSPSSKSLLSLPQANPAKFVDKLWNFSFRNTFTKTWAAYIGPGLFGLPNHFPNMKVVSSNPITLCVYVQLGMPATTTKRTAKRLIRHLAQHLVSTEKPRTVRVVVSLFFGRFEAKNREKERLQRGGKSQLQRSWWSW